MNAGASIFFPHECNQMEIVKEKEKMPVSTIEWIAGLLAFHKGATHRSALITHQTCTANRQTFECRKRKKGQFLGGEKCLPNVFPACCNLNETLAKCEGVACSRCVKVGGAGRVLVSGINSNPEHVPLRTKWSVAIYYINIYIIVYTCICTYIELLSGVSIGGGCVDH